MLFRSVVHLEYYRVPFSYYFRGRALTPFGSHVKTMDEVGQGFAPLLAQAAVGLAGQFLTHPLSAQLSDLTVYLRQPVPDAQRLRVGRAVQSGVLGPSL